jgi:hypothetical protein
VTYLRVLIHSLIDTPQRFVALLFQYLKAHVIIRVMRRFTPLDKILLWMAPEKQRALRVYARNMLSGKLEKRFESDDPKLDLYVRMRIYCSITKLFTACPTLVNTSIRQKA